MHYIRLFCVKLSKFFHLNPFVSLFCFIDLTEVYSDEYRQNLIPSEHPTLLHPIFVLSDSFHPFILFLNIHTNLLPLPPSSSLLLSPRKQQFPFLKRISVDFSPFLFCRIRFESSFHIFTNYFHHFNQQKHTIKQNCCVWISHVFPPILSRRIYYVIPHIIQIRSIRMFVPRWLD